MLALLAVFDHSFNHLLWIHAVCVNAEAAPYNQRGRKSGPAQRDGGFRTRPRPAPGAFSDPQKLLLDFQAPLPAPLTPQPAAQLVCGGGAEEEAETGWI